MNFFDPQDLNLKMDPSSRWPQATAATMLADLQEFTQVQLTQPLATFGYSYLANSGSLVQSVTCPAHTVTNTYEVTRNVLQQKRNTADYLSQITNTPISNFVYGVNDLGQRDDVSRSGIAFASANTETWNYNAKGEVVAADHSTNNAFDRSFQFDGIGNRKKSVDGLDLTDPSATSYTANALNQYSAVGAATRVHDFDGNITDNGTHLYTWDAENRLIEVKKKSDNSTVATYAYDAYSRRITKDVAGVITNFVYDGWNQIAEFTGTTLSKSYVWGMDVSGSMQGAGGVGGLLSVNDGSTTYYPCYDGNGNVLQYVDSTGTVVAHYEYDAFGQATPSSTNTKSFTHQFSTKQLDVETGLNYYGYRYYDSVNGRWLNRDPIKETGGVNIYGFVFNDGLNRMDLLGLESCCGGSPTGPTGGPPLADYMRSNCNEGECCRNGKCMKDQCAKDSPKVTQGELSLWNQLRSSIGSGEFGAPGGRWYNRRANDCCYNQSTGLLYKLQIPDCWQCEIQAGQNWFGRDHVWIYCKAVNCDGITVADVVLDYWENFGNGRNNYDEYPFSVDWNSSDFNFFSPLIGIRPPLIETGRSCFR
jgi:RHS repeat-associated protein